MFFRRSGDSAHERDRDSAALEQTRAWMRERSHSCMLENHRECGHVQGVFGAPEGEVMLCLCACHRSCPVGQKRSGRYVEVQAACTCPGTEEIRRNLERAGIQPDPSRVAQLLEASRQEWSGDEAARKETAKRHIVQAYEAAAAQAAGQPLENHEFVGGSPEAMNIFIDMLANLDSEEEAARLLGLTSDQVTAARDAAHEFRLRTVAEHLPERMRERVRKLPRRPPS